MYNVKYNDIYSLHDQLEEENIIRLFTAMNLYMRESIIINKKLLRYLSFIVHTEIDIEYSQDYKVILSLMNILSSHIELLRVMRKELKDLVNIKVEKLPIYCNLSHNYKSKIFWYKNFEYDISKFNLKRVLMELLRSYGYCRRNAFELYPIIYAKNIPEVSKKAICLKEFCKTFKSIINSVNIATSALSEKVLNIMCNLI